MIIKNNKTKVICQIEYKERDLFHITPNKIKENLIIIPILLLIKTNLRIIIQVEKKTRKVPYFPSILNINK